MYLEDDNYMLQAIEQGKTKKQFDLTRIGEDYIFAVNESKRLMALCTRKEVLLFRQTFRALSLTRSFVRLVSTLYLRDRRALPQHAISQR